MGNIWVITSTRPRDFIWGATYDFQMVFNKIIEKFNKETAGFRYARSVAGIHQNDIAHIIWDTPKKVFETKWTLSGYYDRNDTGHPDFDFAAVEVPIIEGY